VAAENGITAAPNEPFKIVKTATSTARWARFELQLCTEQLLGVHNATSRILQP